MGIQSEDAPVYSLHDLGASFAHSLNRGGGQYVFGKILGVCIDIQRGCYNGRIENFFWSKL